MVSLPLLTHSTIIHQETNLAFLRQRLASLLPLALSPLMTASEPAFWFCTAPLPLARDAPGRAALVRAAAAFTRLYGAEPLTLAPEQAQVAVCDGLLFGLWNGAAESATEELGGRVRAAQADPGIGTQCLGAADGGEAGGAEDMVLSYMFGVAEDGWEDWRGGLTEVRKCA
ncbi:hypothetical protein HYQ45_006257 [Verticillium longisporum]|uniref:Uncharacterized protein n=4 Tax=Verticillium TaxID=1036719 RepID=G2WSR0_VERDV|nr:uncharacterized protein VDAG_00841 [Verticillium dahliae VdLs.17]KAG7123553.1 hypothetical protein HYQ44_002189 [Verticillium longisporum]KAH6701751.1 hypothetical protein EV126DRAFT_496281 [Verticillium dahliae]EGY17159.1 hypothetical protein VDAG_00841 [Verticillium dahliae VdLs.17]KAG7136099.1 hypothetical protein HYQ45_006257 [Verticillium longisporum]PNH32588.1 hypothetical protein BJF96_g4175 [Verticillium dahliae]